jgi:hypothetical protein
MVDKTGCVYVAGLEDIVQSQERLWQSAADILAALTRLKSGVYHEYGTVYTCKPLFHFFCRILEKNIKRSMVI